MSSVFENCSMLIPPDYITPHSPDAVLAAHKLEYWTSKTHRLCHPTRREWVRFALLAMTRRLGLPHVVAVVVVRLLRRSELGDGRAVEW